MMPALRKPQRERTGLGGRCLRLLATVTLLGALIGVAAPMAAQPISFRQAIELALRHSGTLRAASAERVRTEQQVKFERDAYYPSVYFGTSLGYSFGQPIAIAGQAPSIFNITHTQTVFNLATQSSIKAAKSDTRAAEIDYKNQADQVILDTALVYLELDSTQRRLAAAQQQKEAASRALYIAQQRQLEGVGSAVESQRAELAEARVELLIATLESNADTLRARLAMAIGRSAVELEIDPGSLPPPPPPAGEGELSQKAVANSLSVRLADERAHAAHERARAQHRMRYPAIDLAGQYAEFADFNNYSQYYQQFSRHNYSFGLNIRIPLFNLAQNATAAAADAAALKADAEAQTAREEAAAEAVRTRHSLRKLEAAARVAELEIKVAEANIDAVKLQIEQGAANPRDEEMARADVANRQVELLESQFNFQQAQLQLLRQTGELRDWALGK
jgi:outer membrane protein TolC